MWIPRAVVLVDPVLNGAPFKAACAAAGLPCVSVYTIDPPVLTEMDPEHAAGDALSVYGSDPDDVAAWVEAAVGTVLAVVPATEPGVLVANLLADRWGLPGNPAATAPARRDKRAMRRLARERGLRVPRFEVAADAGGAGRAARRIGLPVIVKPATGAGSHNVFLVADPADLRRVGAADRHDLFGGGIDEWLVEEYVRGNEFAVNTFSAGGRHTVLDVWEYQLPTAADYDNPYWDFVQVDPSLPAARTVTAFAERVLEAFEVRVGPCHIEVKLDPTGRPVLIELGARLPGAGIPLLWERHSDFRPYAETLAACLGRPAADRVPTFDGRIGICFIRHEGPPGVLRGWRGLDEVRALPGVDEVITFAEPGELVEPTTSLGTELAKVRLCAPGDAELSALVARVRRALVADVEPLAARIPA
jgi:ATP-grasp domain/L-amino acid ligase C-terminal domain 2